MSWSAIRSITWAEIRAGWRTLVLIGLVAGLAGSAAVGAVAVSRRTATAYDRLAEKTHIDDARGIALADDLVDDVVALPSVRERWTGRAGIAQLEGTFTFLGIVAGPDSASPMLQPIVLEGRLPKRAAGDVIEVVLRDDFQRETGVEVGTEVRATFLTRADYYRFDSGFEGGAPNGPSLTIRVVGVVRLPGSLNSMPPTMAAPEVLRDHPDAFEPGAVWFVRLADGARDVKSFTTEVDELASAYTLPPEATEFPVTDVTATHTAAAGVVHTAELLARALLIVAAAVGVAGLVAVTQALARHHSARRPQTAMERALGLSATQRLVARLSAAAIPAGLAAALTALATVWASRIEPLGAIRNYEPSPGLVANQGVLAAGTASAAAAVLVLAGLTSTVAARDRSARPARPSWVVAQVARLSQSTASVTGLRFAFESGRGARSVPVRSAIAGAAIGTAGVVAGLVFVSSLDRLTGSPERSGVPFDVLVSDVRADGIESLLANEDVDSVVGVEMAPVNLGGRSVPAYSLDHHRGRLAIHLTDGRLPRTPDEIALGRRLQQDLGVAVGDTVTARDTSGRRRPLAVVGIGTLPPFGNEQLGLNAMLTQEGLEAAGTSAPFSSAAVTAHSGVDELGLVDELGEQFEAGPRQLPYEVDNLRQLGRLPAAASGAVGLIALVALANAVMMLVRRRRADLATLRAVGFTSAQTRSSVLIMAAAMAATGVLVGVPLGLAAGRWIWQLTARGAFVGTDSLTPVPLVAALSAGAVLVAVAAAAVPAIRAGRISPALLLRVE